jgi:hypothetical protein
MADSKITALAALTAADPANDMVPIVDVSDNSMAASGTTKRISINNILACSPSATLASATITGNLTVDTNTLFVDSANNRVGIGTASPAAPVDVQGSSLRLQLQSSSNGGYATWKYIGKNSSGTAVNFEQGLNIAADNAFELYDNQNTQLVSRYVSGVSGAHSWFLTGSTAMTLNSTGLGVGGSPSYQIHARKDQAAFTSVAVDNQSGLASGTGSQFLLLDAGTATGWFRRHRDGTDNTDIGYKGSLRFRGAITGTERTDMLIDASGNLLVGTTSGSFRGTFLVAGGANRDILIAGVTGISGGFQVKWNNSTLKINVIIENIPTSSAGLAAGTLWNDAGTIKIA